jgi:hypothetical protein
MKHPRILLLSLLAFVSLTIVPAALFMLARPAAGMSNLSLSVLSYSIFKRLFVLSSLLSIAVDGISFITLIYVLKHKLNANLWCYLTSLALTVWMVTEVILIKQLNWLHLLYFITGIFILLLADIHEHYRRLYYK